jgi:hypothetical protein
MAAASTMLMLMVVVTWLCVRDGGRGYYSLFVVMVMAAAAPW